MNPIDDKSIQKTLKIDARGIGIPAGAASIFIERAMKDARKSLKHKSLITEKDLTRALVKELKKYNADLAYVYKNRGRII